jgi:hypothetical protein
MAHGPFTKRNPCKHGVVVDARTDCGKCEAEFIAELEEFEEGRYGAERRAFFESYENAVNDCRSRYRYTRREGV